jgi:hypothetical protein
MPADKEKEMKINYRTPAGIFGVLAFALSFVPNCAAQCLGGFQPRLTHSNWHSQVGRVQLLPAAFVAKDDGDNDKDDATIVGFWHQKLVSKGSTGIPDGTVVDDGLAQWHSDGTELLNSNRPTISGNFCMGVWEKTGRHTYKLNHFPLSYDPTGTVFVGPINIRAEVTVGSGGKEYSGRFTLDQYDPTGKTLLGHAQGVITGTRITVNSTPQNIF